MQLITETAQALLEQAAAGEAAQPTPWVPTAVQAAEQTGAATQAALEDVRQLKAQIDVTAAQIKEEIRKAMEKEAETHASTAALHVAVETAGRLAQEASELANTATQSASEHIEQMSVLRKTNDDKIERATASVHAYAESNITLFQMQTNREIEEIRRLVEERPGAQGGEAQAQTGRAEKTEPSDFRIGTPIAHRDDHSEYGHPPGGKGKVMHVDNVEFHKLDLAVVSEELKFNSWRS